MGKPFSFAIQCDKLQMSTEGTPAAHTWISLMANAKRIDQDEFESRCDLTDFLEEGEPLSDYMASDPDAGFYRASTVDQTVYFLQTSGFEFFFTIDGRPPQLMALNDDALSLHQACMGDHLARTMLPLNDPRRQGAGGFEREIEVGRDDVSAYQSATHVRFVFTVDGRIAGGLQVETVNSPSADQIFVRREFRRRGLATEMLSFARDYFGGDLSLSSITTDDGKALSRAFLCAPASQSPACDLSPP